MCLGFLSLFRRKGSQAESKQKEHHQPDDYGGLSELVAPSPVENEDGAPVYRHHTLEENIERASQGQDVDAQDENEELLVRHHTLEENVHLAEELSQEIRRQSQELGHQERSAADCPHERIDTPGGGNSPVR